jgi:hypothetical protein
MEKPKQIHTQTQLDHHANQLNPNNTAFKSSLDNRANQLNPNNSLYQGSTKKP